MSFRVAYLESNGRGLDRLEERIVEAELRKRGVDVVAYTQKQIHRRALPLGNDTFIMGAVPAMHGAMKQLGIPVPAPNDYPASLRAFLGRRVWLAPLRELEEQVLERPIFAKPAERKKDFTGRVFSCIDDLCFLGGTSRRQRVWYSDVVEWVSEYRVYVVAQQVVALDHYAGDPSVRIEMSTVQESLRLYGDSREAPAAYGLDFGVLTTGQTALVEANDGYSLGAYAIDGGPYTDLLLARWAELMRQRPGSVDA